jgi:hypothetical protein
MNTLKQLHDATLTAVELDWAAGCFTATFLVGDNQRVVRILGQGMRGVGVSAYY